MVLNNYALCDKIVIGEIIMSDRAVRLHYIRGIQFVDMLLRTITKDYYSFKDEVEFFRSYYNKCREDRLFLFDLNNIIMSCSIALMGLNKEAIEKNDNSKNYGYNIKYNINMSEKFFEDMYKSFRNENIVDTPYKDWLSVSDYSEHVAPSNNFLFNVRNSLMHSEYDFEMQDENSYNYLLCNLHNSNYTGFEGQLYIPYYLEFIKHYYSNDGYFGLVDNLYTIRSSSKAVSNENELNYMLDKLEFYKLNYENSKKASNTMEKKLHHHKITVNDKNFSKEKIELTEEDIEKLKMILKYYYGDKFYTYDNEMQGRIMIQAIKYIKDCKSVFSEWVMHFYICSVGAVRGEYPGENFVSVFATKPALQLIKSYLILYRMQNAKFEDFDYGLINDINYEYDASETHYDDFKNRLINKGINLSEDEYKIRYFCEIYRDALAHGNIKMEFRKDDKDNVTQYFVFEDIYKSRVRVIKISEHELDKFINSKAFARENVKLKVSTPPSTPKR